MSEGFSGVVRLSDIDDFIAPSQNCIIPMTALPTSSKGGIKLGDVGNDAEAPLVSIKTNKAASSTLASRQKKSVKITLNDCLACSGCVTTAEAVLIEQQSGDQLIQALAAHRAASLCDRRIAVVTVSPQSLSSIAASRRLSLTEAAQLIIAFFKQAGADYVMDSSFARTFSLLATFQEFLDVRQSTENADDSSKRPIFASACPGWICYAEKTHGQLLVPYLSKVRSPQAISGALIKNYLAKLKGVDASKIYHATVMPCFDKKLEASRDDFLVPGTDVREVDCVISTVELSELLDKAGAIDTLAQTPSLDWANERWLSLVDSEGNVIGHGGGHSGGYADYVMYRAIRDLFHLTLDQVSISKIQRNQDFEETTVSFGDKVLLRIAKAYGFRNIQNVVQKLKRGKCNYDFVEVMACPGGCTNGGGQIRAETVQQRAATLGSVNELYDSIPVVDPQMHQDAQAVGADWLGSLQSDIAHTLLFTCYHPVNKTILQQQTIKW
uniref:Iron hydrogenase large subunit C-terminal domain-containing protein n=1 Tax=Plectus sambesii TaxID=2011161 RepID=A0A914V2U5_9BILA